MTVDEHHMGSSAPSNVCIVGRYTEEAVTLEGSPQALQTLAHLMTAQGSSHTVNLYVPQGSAAPYTAFLTCVEVVQEGGSVDLKRRNNVLRIAGSPEKLAILAENVRLLASEVSCSSSIQPHMHIEYYPDHFYLAPSSCTLVLILNHLSHESPQTT